MAKEDKKVDTMVRFSPLQVPVLVRMHWNGTPKEPLHFIAEPSTVKSAGVYQESVRIAADEGREFFDWNQRSVEDKERLLSDPKNIAKVFLYADIRASEIDVGELRLQDMANGKPYITFKYNALFAAMSDPEAMGVIFFDEMNLADNMKKGQFYKVINDHAIGDLPISSKVMCISAGNEAEHSRGVTEDPVPLVLRRANYFLRPLNADEFCDHATKEQYHEYVIGYVPFQPQDVHKVEYDLPDSIGQPCPRTWTKLSNVLKANPKLTMDQIEMLATGWVGQGVARKFVAYVKSAQKVDLDAILKSPKNIRALEDNKNDLSMVYAVIAGIVEKFRHDKKVIKPAFEVALEMQRAEFGAYLMRSLKNTDEAMFRRAAGDPKVLDEATVQKVVARYGKFLFHA